MYVYPDQDDYLFSKTSIFDLMAEREARAAWIVENMDADDFLNTTPDDLLEHAVAQCSLEVPELLRDGAHVDEPIETSIRVKDYGRHISVPATSFLLNMPFQGDGRLFDIQPSNYSSLPPRGTVSGQVLYLRVTCTEPDSDAVNKEFGKRLDEIEQYLSDLRHNASELDRRVRHKVIDLGDRRRAKLLAARKVVSSLAFPSRPRSGAAEAYAQPPVRKKIVTRPPSKPSAPFKPEPALDETQYQEILSAIEGMAKSIERSPSAFAGMDEETLRTHFLIPLNGMFEGAASGETFNAAGKTDILIRAEDRNIFIAECKFWHGPKSISDAMDQLLSYLTWRDTKAALIVFNRNRDFTGMLSALKTAVEAHPQMKRGPKVESETRFRYVFRSSTDEAREIIVTVLAFDVPAPSV